MLLLLVDDSACGGDGTPGPTAPPPPPAPTNCGSPQWANDQWCDDENNNADCNYDGGACCNNDFSGWDTYCTVCECLEGGTTTEAPAPTTTQAPAPTTTQAPGPTTTQGPTECGKISYKYNSYFHLLRVFYLFCS